MKYGWFLFIILIYENSFAQINLVPNGDFESYSNCPNTLSQINLATPWFQPFIPQNSTDYFNSCGNSLVGIPINWMGYQQAYSGIGYANFFISGPGLNGREYLETTLLDSLINGHQYCVTFYISLANNSRHATNNIGALFTTDSLMFNSPPSGLLIANPQFETTSIINFQDTIYWMQLMGDFISSGGEKYLTIGNFKDDSITNTILVNNNGVYSGAYYYIDDVSVIEGPCSTGLNEVKNEEVKIFPNPATEQINFSNEVSEIKIMDVTGRVIQYYQNNTATLSISSLPQGLFFISCFLNKTPCYFKLEKK